MLKMDIQLKKIKIWLSGVERPKKGPGRQTPRTEHSRGTLASSSRNNDTQGPLESTQHCTRFQNSPILNLVTLYTSLNDS